ncbi:MAG: phosphatidylglycerol lysyltransferase domain-containing protein [bacterium]
MKRTLQQKIPQLIALTFLLVGILNIISAIWLRESGKLILIEDSIPLEMIHASRLFTLLTGFALLYVARGLWEAKKRAWVVSIVILMISIVIYLFKGFVFHEVLLLILMLVLLVTSRSYFVVQAEFASIISRFKLVGVILGILFIYSFFGFFLFQGEFSHTVKINNIVSDYFYSILGIGKETLVAKTHRARIFEESITIAGVTAVILSLDVLFYPLVSKKIITKQEQEQLRKLVLSTDVTSDGYFALLNDKEYFENANQDCFLGYKIKNRNATVLGGPIGNAANFLNCLKEFVQEMKLRGLSISFYNVNHADLNLFKQAGFKSIKIAEEAIINTEKFSLAGHDMADIRYGVRKLEKLGIKFEWYNTANIPWRRLSQIDELHKLWLAEKKLPAMTFSTNFYPFPVEENVDILAVFQNDNQLLAAFSFFPYQRCRSRVLDQMLRSEKIPNGLIEGAIAEAINHFKSLGIAKLSLGNAPLSNIDVKLEGISEKSLHYIFNNFNRLYQFKSLYRFKSKFKPSWQHKFLCYKSNLELPKVLISLIQCQSS